MEVDNQNGLQLTFLECLQNFLVVKIFFQALHQDAAAPSSQHL